MMIGVGYLLGDVRIFWINKFLGSKSRVHRTKDGGHQCSVFFGHPYTGFSY